MAREKKVVFVETLLQKAQDMIDDGLDDYKAADAALEGVDLFELLVTDGSEVSRLFRDGFLHKLNRRNAPSQWWRPGAAVTVENPGSLHIETTNVDSDVTPIRIQVRFLNAQYQVSRGNLFVRQMTAEDLVEAGSNLIHDGEGMIDRGMFLKVDVPKALKKYKVATPEELPVEALVGLEDMFSGRQHETA